MYANFEVILKGDNYFLYPPSLWYSTEPEGEFYLLTAEYPGFFKETKKGIEYLDRQGFRNLPGYRFNIEKYRTGEMPFEQYDVSNDPWFKKRVRSDRITRNIRFYFDHNVELKYHRKAIALLLKLILKLIKKSEDLINEEELDLIDQFSSLEMTIESIISRHPKDNDALKKIDLFKESGIENKEKE